MDGDFDRTWTGRLCLASLLIPVLDRIGHVDICDMDRTDRHLRHGQDRVAITFGHGQDMDGELDRTWTGQGKASLLAGQGWQAATD